MSTKSSTQEKGAGGSSASPKVIRQGESAHVEADADNSAASPGINHVPLPDEAYPVGPLIIYEKQRRFVMWQAKDGRKPPYNSYSNDPIAANDHVTQQTLAEVREGATKRGWSGKQGGIGIVPGDDLGYLDLDSCRDPETGKVGALAIQIVERFNSYTEVSPSGTGLKIIFNHKIGSYAFDACTSTAKLKSKDKEHQRGFELRFHKIYTTVTGKQFEDYSELRVVEAEHFEWLDKEVKPHILGASVEELDLGMGDDEQELELVKSALNAIDPADNDTWIRGLYAFKDRFKNTTVADAARQAAIDWLRIKNPEKFAHRNAEMDVGKRYDGLKPNRINIGWVINTAKEAGWKSPYSKQGGEADHDSHDVDENPLPPPSNFPEPMGKAAFHGVVGEIVEILRPHTHVSAENLLVHLLVGLGNMVGHAPYFQIGGNTHHTNLFALVIGESGVGKGSGWSLIECLLNDIDSDWATTKIASGLESAEGLIERVRDPSEKVNDEGKPIDPGVDDKRFLAIEEDFVRGPVAAMKRAGNKLNDTLRKAYDGKILQSITRQHARDSKVGLRATGAHISVIGHGVRAEVLQFIDPIETENGFLNRFVITAVGRGADVVFPTPYADLRPLLQKQIQQLKQLMRKWAGNAYLMTAHPPQLIPWDEDAMVRYTEIHREYQAKQSGMTARSLPNIIRLALNYAVYDDETIIRIKRQHLDAGLAIARYSEASVHYLFGDAPGNKYARSVLSMLRHAGSQGCPRSKLLRTVRCSADELDIAMDALHDAARILYDLIPPKPTGKRKGGKPSTVWFIAEKAPKGAK